MDYQRFIDNLARQAEENPVVAMGVAAGLVTALTQLMNANTNRRKARTWDRETMRREMKDRKR